MGDDETKMTLGNTGDLSGSVDSNMENKITVNGKRRKLIIHFDLRNTVLVSDSVTNVSMEQALNSFLTGVVWGKTQPDGSWRWHSYKPSLVPPAEGTVTFYKYLERKLVKTPKDRTLLRIATGDFAQKDKNFLPYFQSHIEKMKWQHPYVPDSGNKLTMCGSDGKHYHYILPSVYKAIHRLHEEGRDFAIVFRTYGLDTPNVISSVGFGLAGNHPGFPKDLGVQVNENVGKVKRDNKSITFQTFSNGSLENEYKTDRDIYTMLSNSDGVSGFMDDFLYWQDNGYMYTTAKPLYIDPFDHKVQHIFFDDNFRTYENDSIIDVKVFQKEGATVAASILRPEIEKFQNMCAVQADLMTAIDDDDYFINCIRTCEDNYTNFLTKFHCQS